MSFDPSAYLSSVKSVFSAAGDPERAQGQMKYMRHQFEFYGLKAPEWMALARQVFKEGGLPDGEVLKETVRLCMQDEYREINYFGIELTQRQLKKQDEDFIVFLEELITTRSWWDTVDWLAKMAGTHFLRFPRLTIPVTERWMDSGNLWLQRSCLIFQLMYKGKTDFELMKKYILALKGSNEFFLQKGAGWALREYSKTDADAVVGFLEAHPELASLTRREGLKWLKR